MIPAGYLYKKIEPRPAGFQGGEHIVDICSLSGCISEPFMLYIEHWRHNAFWLFDTPEAMQDLAKQEGISLNGQTLFYVEVHPDQFDVANRQWSRIQFEAPSIISAPKKAKLLGFDVVSHMAGNAPECSPLSCNGLYQKLDANIHCLFPTFADAQMALDSGAFEGAEPGPYRIYSIAKIG
jgi:hypothetical protein